MATQGNQGNQGMRSKEEARAPGAGQTGATEGRRQEETGTVGSVMEKAKDTASSVARGASDLASSAGRKAEDATSSVGSGLQSLAGTLREHAPREGMVGSAASTVASTLESGGRYLQEEGLSGMMDDLTNVIRRNPIPALLVGIGIGFLLARTTSRS